MGWIYGLSESDCEWPDMDKSATLVFFYLNSHPRQTLASKSVFGGKPELTLLYPELTGEQVGELA